MTILQPDARVYIYNYIDRLGYQKNDDVNAIEERIDISPYIISIQTNKLKVQPSGNFVIVLAPNKNWISTISPGSWLTIHIKSSRITEGEEFESDCLKMIGRVDSVRCQVQVDQTTGARNTLFYISGRDWGQIFESIFYMDILATWNGDNSLSGAIRYGFDSQLLEAVKKGTYLATTTQMVDFFIKLWGNNNSSMYAAIKNKEISSKYALSVLNSDRLLPQSTFTLPNALSQDLGWTDGIDLAQEISILAGIRDINTGKYEDTDESVGFPDMSSLVGGQPLWSILHSVCNTIVNELVVELIFDKDVRGPRFGLYKRVKPFYLGQDLNNISSSIKSGSNGEKIKSHFLSLKKVYIDLSRIVGLDYGTNWLDRINFVEIIGSGSTVSKHIGPYSGIVAKMTDGVAVYDASSYGREGIKPMLMSTVFVPPAPQNSDNLISAIAEWSPIVASWYFDIHKMLNGTLSIVGQDEYIEVGSNVMFPSSAFLSKTTSSQQENTNIVAHVESVSNQFSIDQNGNRNFITTLTFVRGINTSEDGLSVLNSSEFGIDTDATKMNSEDEQLSNIVGIFQ